jgi:hypothetical protein
MADATMGQAPNHHNLFRGLIKGVLVGFAVALLFVIAAALLSAMGLSAEGTAYAFLTTPAYMGLFGFFVGLGLEVYPILF